MTIKTMGTQKESTIVNINPDRKQPQILHYDLDYDSCKPENTIRNFVKDIRGMIARFDYDKKRIKEIEDELLDIYHYIEISSFKTVPNGYRLYRKMAELRRERRACKNEIDLLKPIYEYFNATEVLGRLSNVQGECAVAKSAIDSRVYVVRTDVLEELRDIPARKKLSGEDGEEENAVESPNVSLLNELRAEGM